MDTSRTYEVEKEKDIFESDSESGPPMVNIHQPILIFGYILLVLFVLAILL